MEENEVVEQVEPTQETVAEETVKEETAPTQTEQVEEEDLSVFDKVKQSEKEFEELKNIGNSKEDTNNYTYDEDLEQWVDQNGKLYDEKPQAQSQGQFNPYDYAISQKENEINQIKNDIIRSKERECVEQFEKEFADIKDNLTATQWEVLKHDVIVPPMEELAEAIMSGKYTEDVLKQIKVNISNGIEARKSIYNLRKQVQDNINTEKNTNYPLESKAPTGVQSVEDTGTFEGKSKRERNSILDSIANKFKNLV